MKIQWNQGVDLSSKNLWVVHLYCLEINFDPLLITCFEGLKETKHPYNFVAIACIRDLFESDVI